MYAKPVLEITVISVLTGQLACSVEGSESEPTVGTRSARVAERDRHPGHAQPRQHRVLLQPLYG